MHVRGSLKRRKVSNMYQTNADQRKTGKQNNNDII